MPKYTHPDVFDNGLLLIKNNANAQHLCSSCPTTRAEVLTYSLANVVMASGDFTVQNGDVSGRKITITQKSTTASANGTAQWAALIDGTRLLHVTSCAAQSLYSGNPVTLPTWDYEMRQPT
jgi:hypothetical protein